jgi:type VI secretion system protein ImpJ
LAEKSAVLSVYSQGRTLGRSGFSQGEVSGFWFLNTVNSSLPTLRHLLRLGSVHPEELFAAMLRLAGSLCTFGLDSKPDSLPLYDHDRLTEKFEELENHIQTHLEFVIPTNCVTIPLKAYGDYFHAGAVQDERCLGTSRWILSVRASLGEADLISRAPKLIKVCSAMHIKKLVEKALPGLVLAHISSPPTAISPKISNQYFSITKTGPCWDHIVSSRQVGVYVPREIPGLQIEILVVL